LAAVGFYTLLIPENKSTSDETGEESLKKGGLKLNVDNQN
jgi:hypothetical protein